MTVAREADLRRRFETRLERFHHAGLELELLLPRAADALIDEAAFDADERLPYWAELWPAARALARHLLEAPPREQRVVELGCGVALPSLVLLARGTDVLATDYYADALAFARVNAHRNGLAALRTRLLDWRHPPADLERCELALAADVLYERRNADALAGLLPRLLAPGGRLLLADPGRVYLGSFLRALREAGWATAELETREETSDPATGAVSRVRVLELLRPAL